MKKSIFLSYPQPFLERQKKFIDCVISYLSNRGFEPRTLGVTDYDMESPLIAIRRLMCESNGLITIAFRRTLIEQGIVNPLSNIGRESLKISNQWLTSPYCHIEPAMAFQLGLPILIFKEDGVIEDGIIQKGVTGLYLPSFNLDDDTKEYFKKEEWIQIIEKWEHQVKSVVNAKGYPPKMY